MSSLPIPQFLKAIFNSFPLLEYPETPLPARCPRPSALPSLYVFSTPQDATFGNPSVNPDCLKWQAYLKFSGIEHRVIPSSNHASPSGALPFLICNGPTTNPSTVPTNRLAGWARKNRIHQLQEADVDSAKAKAFQALIDSRLHDAWLYALYLEPNNFRTLAAPFYCASSTTVAETVLSHRTQAAATEQLLRGRPGGVINPDDIYADVDSAASAIATLLGEDEWFFGAEDAGLFDAAVFSYTHLILTMRWDRKEARLRRAIRRHANLVAHEKRIREEWFPKASAPGLNP